jgi:16S rRNA processing protein RimM
VAAPYGVHGWLKVVPYTATAEALLRYRTWRMSVPDEQGAREFRLVEGRVHGAVVVAQLEGIDTREQAASLRGAMVEVPREALPREGDGEVYLADLPGCRVVSAKGEALGSVQDVAQFGAHPVLRVRDERGTERLIPLVAAYVNGVDLEARLIEVDWEADY